MFKKAVFPGKYIQGLGAIGELPALINLLGKQGLILASPSVKDKVLPGCGVDWSACVIPVEVFRGECCEHELSRLLATIAKKKWMCWSAWAEARPLTRRKLPLTGRAYR